VDDFNGLNKRAPFWAFAMIVFLLSLGGIPPTAGFIGKYFLFYAAVEAGFGWLAIIAVLMSAVSMFFYFRLVMAMYLKEGREAPLPVSGALRFVAIAAVIVTLVLGVLPQRLIETAKDSGSWVATRSAAVLNGR
jgi:NADH-quinone oxidoreductase subunit N